MKIIISEISGDVNSYIENSISAIQTSSTMMTSGLYLVSAGLVNVYTKDEVEQLLDNNFNNYYTKTEIENITIDGGNF